MFNNETNSNDYVPTPTAYNFHLDTDSIVKLLFGPVGSGKSAASCMEILRIMRSVPKQKDGYRYSRHLVIRETYPALKTTSLKTWLECFPVPQTGRIVMGSPIVHYFQYADIKAEVLFMSMEREHDIKKLMSLEVTSVWINEARYSLREILRIAVQRCGRYPTKKSGWDGKKTVIMDTNPCDDDHWIYKLFEENCPEGYSIYKYPPAVIKDKNGAWVPNPNADNLHNLPGGMRYYRDQLLGNSEEWIKVYLRGEYGTSYEGRPVYPEYNDRVHCIDNLQPVQGVPLTLGWDFGLTPACIISQLLPNGQLLVLDEVVTEYMGLTNFITNMVLPLLSSKYSGYTVAVSIGDPAGQSKSALLDESQTSFTILKDHGIPSIPAKTNDLVPRRESVGRRLSSLIDGQPGYLLSSTCNKLRKGFNGAYNFSKKLVAVSKGETKYVDVPEKNQYSHPHDGNQYICLHYDSFRSNSTVTKENRVEQMRKLGLVA